MRVLITGATGFIGRALSSRLAFDNKVIGVYHRKEPANLANIVWEQADPPASPEPACHCKARAGRRERPARLALRSIAGRWRAGLTDWNSVAAVCEKYSPSVVIHCAGIAHQKIGAVDLATYMCVNSEATENLARAAGATPVPSAGATGQAGQAG